VHQVFAPDPADAARYDTMSEAQRVSARCQRYLADQGRRPKNVGARDGNAEGPAVHFSANELREMNIVTPQTVAANAEASGNKP
jgi:hypothetical protein